MKIGLCSFCGKSQADVEHIICGPAVYICNECVELCQEIIDDSRKDKRKTSMEERRFIIREWGLDDPNPGWTISEDELIRRLNIICDEMHSPSRSIDILLNGEGEKVPEGCIVNPVLSRVCERGTKSCGVYHQPSHTPTRKEWERWARDVAYAISMRTTKVYEIEDAFLSMPCVPKGEKHG